MIFRKNVGRSSLATSRPETSTIHSHNYDRDPTIDTRPNIQHHTQSQPQPQSQSQSQQSQQPQQSQPQDRSRLSLSFFRTSTTDLADTLNINGSSHNPPKPLPDQPDPTTRPNHPHTMKTIALHELLNGPPKDFSPVAYYDKHMDCIRVELRDCSVTEVRIDQTLTLLRDNDPSEDQHSLAGVKIKGIKHLFKSWGLDLEGVHLVTTIVNRLLADLPVDPENVDLKTKVEEVNFVAAAIELKVDMREEYLEAA